MAGDAAAGYRMFCQAAEIADRFSDRDLIALARHSRGRTLIRMGRIQDGVRLLDDAMIAVDAGDVSPLVVGDVYCSVIEGCLEVFDLRRAHEWTAALTRWCETQPDLVPYSGQCLVRRAEILQLHGAWPEAIDAARQACDRLLRPPTQAAACAAFYQCGELHRASWATSANRDERVFGDPDAYDPDAHAADNLVYGTGIHVCPGRPLATMELVTVADVLLASTTEIALDEDDAPERETYPLGGWRRVPVRLRV